MNILLEKDKSTPVDIHLAISALRALCTELNFTAADDRDIGKHSTEYVDTDGEFARIGKRMAEGKYDMCFYLTNREFADNYFVHVHSGIVVLSLAHWAFYSPAPPENGFLHYIARYVALGLTPGLKHDDVTGCVYDFHYYKPGIDLCLKEGRVCSACKKEVRKAIRGSKAKEAIYRDIVAILHAVANTTRSGRSVYSVIEDMAAKDLNWETFEDAVAQHYRNLGARVEQNVNVAGFQIDALVTERTPSGRDVKSIIECKFMREKAGNRLVNDFARVAETIRSAGLADAAVLVSHSGFTQDAHLVAKAAKVTLAHFKDLVPPSQVDDVSAGSSPTQPLPSATSPPKAGADVFVIMPFSPDMDDLYFFGIHQTVNNSGGSCIRMDQEQFTGSILEQLYDHIANAHVIVAEVSKHNPNVFYEVGYAHALKRPVILVTNDIKTCPFDLAGFNHIVYTNIKDLQDKLGERLAVLLK